MKKIVLTVGARPNFMKAAPLYRVLQSINRFSTLLLHTGQHYDYEMSRAFFEDLELPEPDYHLQVGSDTQAAQTARIMIGFEKVLDREKPQLVVVFGDVNSTLACALTAKKMGVPVAHVEAGLRSFDETMPEEINRKLTDALADLLFTPSAEGSKNLEREAVAGERIFFVGNIMIDSLRAVGERIEPAFEADLLAEYKVTPRDYGLITLHRPANVDDQANLQAVFRSLDRISRQVKLIFPVHPRTLKNMEEAGIEGGTKSGLVITEPLRYKEFIALERNAGFVLTDSGGIQEETTYLGIPCFTLRPNTERPVTIEQGTNRLVTLDNLEAEVLKVNPAAASSANPQRNRPPLWDGKTAERIGEILTDIL
jgi:UDP-N-acetylglucosamine 2-epimerase (non-hydrolysing)